MGWGVSMDLGDSKGLEICFLDAQAVSRAHVQQPVKELHGGKVEAKGSS